MITSPLRAFLWDFAHTVSKQWTYIEDWQDLFSESPVPRDPKEAGIEDTDRKAGDFAFAHLIIGMYEEYSLLVN